MTIDVVYAHSEMPSAPVLSGQVGSMISLLDALLVNGFGTVSVTSCVVAAGICTCTVAGGHSHEVDGVALLSGAATSVINGRQRITATTTNTFSFETSASNGTISGTIVSKVAPAGWVKQYTGTNKAVYKPSVAEASGCVLRVDDSQATYARVTGFESMSDVDTGTGQFPTVAQVNIDIGCYTWHKSDAASSSARRWKFFADGQAFYIILCNHSASQAAGAGPCWLFGDIKAYKSGDAYACNLAGSTSTSMVTGAAEYGNMAVSRRNGIIDSGEVMARSAHGIGGSVQGWHFAAGHVAGTASNEIAGTTGVTWNTFPDVVDNSLPLMPIIFLDWYGTASFSNPVGFRGEAPGLLWPNCRAAFAIPDKSRIAGQGELSGKKLYCAWVSYTNGTTGLVFFDITGSWR